EDQQIPGVSLRCKLVVTASEPEVRRRGERAAVLIALREVLEVLPRVVVEQVQLVVEIATLDTTKRLLLRLTGSADVKAAGPKLITAADAPQPYDHGRLHGLRAQIALRGGHSYW